MRVKWFEWEGAGDTTRTLHHWASQSMPVVDVMPILHRFLEAEDRDAVVLDLTAQFDATESAPKSLRVEDGELAAALSVIDPDLRGSLEVAASNIRTVAEAQVDSTSRRIELPQGQSVEIREVPVNAAGIYAPGGRAAYPSSVLMCAIPARVAGVQRIALATPPGPDGTVNSAVLAAAALCEVDEVYAMGGAQAIFALAHGTQDMVAAVNVIAGPGNAWVREAKAQASTAVAIDSLAGPSELMVLVDGSANMRWVALDLCAQAEHGAEAPLVAVATDAGPLEELVVEVKRAAASRSGVGDAPLALVEVPSLDDAIEFINTFAPEHLELMVTGNRNDLAERVLTAGCIFSGFHSATAFGDYVAGSNHVLPTGGAGKFSGPLGPGIFRRKIATVEVPPEAAAKLAPHVNTIARAEGFPIHGESAMIRAND